MPNFTPNSEIHIGRVPWDNSYRHTRTFANTSAQTTWMLARCTTALDKSNYTYVRMNNAIRVPFNAESLYTYNYVMYQNKNYGTKWFYAFIVAVNYVNENMTELVLELDVMQTWYFDYTLKECFVEREHVNDDTVGMHLNPEPSMDLKYYYDSFHQNSYGDYYIIVLVNALPRYRISGLDTVPGGSDPVSGGKFQNYYSGCMPIVFRTDNSGITAFKKLLDDLNKGGAAETITDIYTVPSDALPGMSSTLPDSNYLAVTCNRDLGGENPPDTITLANTWTLAQNVVLSGGENWIPKPTAHDSYTPKNNKLLTYPYTYLEVGDFTGRKENFCWEYFTQPDNQGRVGLQFTLAGISDHVGYITPISYQGVDNSGQQLKQKVGKEPFTFSFDNKISWTFSAYQTWLAQNAMANQLAAISGTAAILGTFIPGINAYVNNEKETHSLNSGAIAAGAVTLGGLAANISRMSRTPDKSRGNTQGNSKFQNNYSGWYYCRAMLRREFAEIVDKFFTMYGYQVDIIKIPNREGRTYWNYIKTANACHWGNVPASDMAKINFIYDSGITFWHTDDVGNYSLNNAIVTP